MTPATLLRKRHTESDEVMAMIWQGGLNLASLIAVSPLLVNATMTFAGNLDMCVNL